MELYLVQRLYYSITISLISLWSNYTNCMQLTQNKENRARLSFLLTFLLLFQIVGTSFAMPVADSSTIKTPSSSDIATYTHSEHTSDHCGNWDASLGGDQHSFDCCAAACCPVVTNAGTLSLEFTKIFLALEYNLSFTPVTLPIEIKPPRLIEAI